MFGLIIALAVKLQSMFNEYKLMKLTTIWPWIKSKSNDWNVHETSSIHYSSKTLTKPLRNKQSIDHKIRILTLNENWIYILWTFLMDQPHFVKHIYISLKKLLPFMSPVTYSEVQSGKNWTFATKCMLSIQCKLFFPFLFSLLKCWQYIYTRYLYTVHSVNTRWTRDQNLSMYNKKTCELVNKVLLENTFHLYTHTHTQTCTPLWRETELEIWAKASFLSACKHLHSITNGSNVDAKFPLEHWYDRDRELFAG